jgi:predicted nucleotidyltransferase
MRAFEERPLPGPIDAETARGARAFIAMIERHYAVTSYILFGSRARADHSKESDADIAVVLDGVPSDRTAVARAMAGIAFDVMQETGILVDALPLWPTDLENPNAFSNPALIHNVQRDGLKL